MAFSVWKRFGNKIKREIEERIMGGKEKVKEDQMGNN